MSAVLCAPNYREFQIAVLLWECENKNLSQFISNIFESLLETTAQKYYDNVVNLRYLKPRVA